MSSQVCPICGKTPKECKEWRPCPKMDKQLICGSEHCIVCEYWRKPEDKDTFWCTYYHGRLVRQRIDMPSLKNKIRTKEKIADDLYRRGKWRAAEDIIWEVVDLKKKIKEAEREIHIS